MKEVEEALKTIPDVEKILDEAVEALGIDKMPTAEVEKNFERLLVELESTASKIYVKHEEKAFEKLVEQWLAYRREWVTKTLSERGEAAVKDIALELVKPVRMMEFRAGQMRKARGGKTFELAVEKLLKCAGVPCQKPDKDTRTALKRIDLVSPDADTAKQTPDKAIFISVKRTLRERWKQVVPEQMKSARIYLVTINGELTGEKAEEIRQHGIVVYVRDSLKNMQHLKEKTWVRSLSELPKDIKNSVPRRPDST
ncbi:MAG: type II restriction endonuclease [Candidatus Caldarchaeum sp.]